MVHDMEKLRAEMRRDGQIIVALFVGAFAAGFFGFYAHLRFADKL